MGCDIHLHTEVKIKGEWYTYGSPQVSRNYEMFGILAGVRRGGPALFPVKGFPEDAAVVTRLSYEDWGTDAHTPSYLTSDEIDEFAERWKSLGGNVECSHGGAWPSLEIGYLMGNGWESQYGYPDGIEDVRWVFWFDN